MNLEPYWDYILEVSRQRLAHNQSRYHVSQYGTQLEVRGAAGELAARLYFGMEPVLHGHYDGGIDLFYAGKSIDVKTQKLVRAMEYRFLQWPEKKEVSAEIVVAAAVQLRQKRAAMLGWVRREEVLSQPVNFERPYPCREVAIVDLHPMWRLVAEQSYMDYVEGGRIDEDDNPI